MTERSKRLAALARERGERVTPTHFGRDYHYAALHIFDKLPHAEKLARSMAYALVNQDVFAYPEDGIGGRVYYSNEAPIPEKCDELDCDAEPMRLLREKYPDIDLLRSEKLVPGTSKGHISWRYDRLLALGVEGLREQFSTAASVAKDEEAREFYSGVVIMLDALLEYNDKYADEYERLGNHELAALMRRVPRYPATGFREAVQSYFMQHIVVMRENPHGGNSPGRLDYFLWPYLEKDLAEGKCTLEEARELIDELFLRIDERIHKMDKWGETIVLGGTKPDGSSAINPLTHIMIESYCSFNITHPLLYLRLPETPTDEEIRLAASYTLNSGNRAQILNDRSIIGALVANRVPYEDAVDYYCGGCMEVGIQGRNSDLLYYGWQSIPKMVELMITGGVCLKTGKQFPCFTQNGGLIGYSDFESFYRDFIEESKRLVTMGLESQDYYSAGAEKNRPAYLMSAMLDDCFERGRNMHAGGARYHDYGATPLGLPNAADSLYAIKRAVFEEKICTAEELIEALRANFDGYDRLRARLGNIPKYGMDNDDADAFATRLISDFADMYIGYRTRFGGTGKPIVLSFVFNTQAAERLGATADGKRQGGLIAHSLTPQSSSMTEGITAAINSLGKIDFSKFNGGASSMWDFDDSWVTEDILHAVLKTFVDKNAQIFQGNTTSVDEMIKAQQNPEEYKNLIVRVGGYSARFTNLGKDLQNDIIERRRHCC